VTAEYLEALNDREPELQSFITVDADGARAQVIGIITARVGSGLWVGLQFSAEHCAARHAVWGCTIDDALMRDS
jgi:hypothetical protein